MKILLTSDMHVGIRKKNGVMFIDFAMNYLRHIKSYCKRYKINTIFFLGDILEKSSNVKHEYFTPLFKMLKGIVDEGISLYYLLGNHDIYTRENDSLVETFPGKIIKHQENIKINNIDFNFLSYTEKKIENLKGDYLLTHLPIENFKMNNDYIPDKKYYPASLFKDFKKVFSGHYHLHQSENNIVYLGSPFQLNFSESDSKKGFVVLNINNNKWNFVEYKNGPKFKIINDYTKKENIENTFVKVKLERDEENFHAIKQDFFSRGALSVELDFMPEKIKELNYKENIKLDNSLYDIIKKFLKNYKEEGINNDKLIEIFENVHKEVSE